MAPLDSLPKTKCVIETSSSIMSKLSARFVKVERIWVLCVYVLVCDETTERHVCFWSRSVERW